MPGARSDKTSRGIQARKAFGAQHFSGGSSRAWRDYLVNWARRPRRSARASGFDAKFIGARGRTDPPGQAGSEGRLETSGQRTGFDAQSRLRTATGSTGQKRSGIRKSNKKVE